MNSSNLPLVTICVPTFNSESSIEKTLLSLANQTYKNIKIKVFDNASTDRTEQIVKKLIVKNPTIEYYRLEKNIGAEGNFTKCIQASEGDFSGVYHADDIYYPDMISSQVDYFLANPTVVAVGVHAHTIDSAGNVFGSRFLPKEISNSTMNLNYSRFRTLTFNYGNFVTCPSVLVRTWCFLEHIKEWRGSKYKTSADLDVWMRLAKLGDIAIINRELMGYRVGIESYSFRIAKVRTTEHDLFLVLRDHLKGVDQYDFNAFHFLEVKDIALRSLNIIRSKNKVDDFPNVEVNWPIVIRSMFNSYWHFKMFFSILGIFIIRDFFSLSVRKLVFKNNG